MKHRFWDKVNKNGPPHPTDNSLGRCWLWMGAKIRGKYQYGLIWNDRHNKIERAHRVSWILTNGKIPKDKGILHSCDNPACVNPEHLRVGTDADNHRDMVSRGRSCVGERNGQCVLTQKQVEEIRLKYPKAYRTGPRPKEEKDIIDAICKKYGITPDSVSRIARRGRWKHI